MPKKKKTVAEFLYGKKPTYLGTAKDHKLLAVGNIGLGALQGGGAGATLGEIYDAAKIMRTTGMSPKQARKAANNFNSRIITQRRLNDIKVGAGLGALKGSYDHHKMLKAELKFRRDARSARKMLVNSGLVGAGLAGMGSLSILKYLTKRKRKKLET